MRSKYWKIEMTHYVAVEGLARSSRIYQQRRRLIIGILQFLEKFHKDEEFLIFRTKNPSCILENNQKSVRNLEILWIMNVLRKPFGISIRKSILLQPAFSVFGYSPFFPIEIKLKCVEFSNPDSTFSILQKDSNKFLKIFYLS